MIIMINCNHPLLSLLSFKENDAKKWKDLELYKITPPQEIWLKNFINKQGSGATLSVSCGMFTF